MTERTFVIAEAGVNHNGRLDLALGLVDAAAAAGADAVKFQTFRASELATGSAPKADYQRRTTGAESQLEMLARLELDEAEHVALQARCAERGIEFMSSAFDLGSLELLLRLGVRRLKLGSGELTNGPLLLAAARSGRPVIVSSGMATLAEIETSLGRPCLRAPAPGRVARRRPGVAAPPRRTGSRGPRGIREPAPLHHRVPGAAGRGEPARHPGARRAVRDHDGLLGPHGRDRRLACRGGRGRPDRGEARHARPVAAAVRTTPPRSSRTSWRRWSRASATAARRRFWAQSAASRPCSGHPPRAPIAPTSRSTATSRSTDERDVAGRDRPA